MDRQRFESAMRPRSLEAVPTKSGVVFELSSLDFDTQNFQDFIDSLESQKEYHQQFLNLWEEIFKKYPCLEYIKDQYSEKKFTDSSNKQKVLSDLQAEDLEPDLIELFSEFAFFGASSYVDFLKKYKNTLDYANKEQRADFAKKIKHTHKILKKTFEIVSRSIFYWKTFKFARENLKQQELFPEDERGQFSVNWNLVEEKIGYAIEEAAERKYNRIKKCVYVKTPEEAPICVAGGTFNNNQSYVLLNVHNLEEISQNYDSIVPRPNKGLLLVKSNNGSGYINSSGKDILKPQAGGEVPEYYNGCKLVSDGIKVANAETGEEFFKIEPVTQKVFLSGNIFVISTELSQLGTNRKYNFQIRDFNNQIIQLGELEDFVEVTNRYDSVPYKNDRQNYGFSVTGLSVAFKVGGKWGLLDTLSGKVVKEAICDKIERFNGGSEWQGNKRIDKNYILTQSEGELELLDENFNPVFSQKYKTFEELEKAFDEKFPDNNRKHFIIS